MASTHNRVARRLMPTIATERDMQALQVDLTKEVEQHPAKEGFINNWSLIERHFRASEITVLHETDDDRPVAFAALHTQEIVMFWVRSDRQQKGIGRHFSDILCWAAKSQGTPGLLLQDVREGALSFWEKVGFIRVPVEKQWDYSGIVMTKTFPHDAALDDTYTEDGRPCDVQITLHRDVHDCGVYTPYGDMGTARGYYFTTRRGNYIDLEHECVFLIGAIDRTAISVSSTRKGVTKQDFDRIELKKYLTDEKHAYMFGDRFISFKTINITNAEKGRK